MFFTLLIVLCISALYLFILKKELVLFPLDKSPFLISSFYDGEYGGNSKLLAFEAGNSIKLRYKLGHSEMFPFAGIDVKSDFLYLVPNFNYDTIIVRVRGKKLRSVRIQFKIFQEGVTKLRGETTYRRIGFSVPVSGEYETYTLKLKDFETEAWWYQFNNLDSRNNYPLDFSKVVSVQISEDNSSPYNEELEFEISHISLQRDPFLLYICLLCLLPLYYLVILVIYLVKTIRLNALLRQLPSGETVRQMMFQASSFKEMGAMMTQTNSGNKGTSVLDSLTSAQKIQQSILPGDKVMQNVIGDHFVLWQPRDIVGGDFYWFKLINNGYVLAVIDCAGHGLPGAFITMKIHSILERVAEHCEYRSPSRMLMFVSKIVQDTRNIENSPNDLFNEELDISLCIVKPAKRVLYFAGARQHLFHAQNGKVDLIRGDKKSIGTEQTSVMSEFTTHKIHFSRHDTFFLTSDGFLDQDDPVTNMPMGTRRFGRFIKEGSNLSMDKQKTRFQSFLQKNLKDKDQLDDITLIGFRPLV